MMMLRVKFSTICIAIGACALLLLVIMHYSYHESNCPAYLESHLYKKRATFESDLYDSPQNYEKLLENTRLKIRKQLKNYNFTLSGVNGLNDLLMDRGGQPIRSVIISTWRSGSTFLGEILNVMPASFYHYEPFYVTFNEFRIRDGPVAKKATIAVKNLLNCNYEDFYEYFTNKLHYVHQFRSNKPVWELCRERKYFCLKDGFMEAFCRQFPFQSMKVVRLQLRLVKEILLDEKLNVRVVLLIRDPRAVLNSRLQLDFCQVAPDCRMPEWLCADMVSDYAAASKLIVQFPSTFRVLRYEDLALDPKSTAYELFKFLRLGDLQSLDEFLDSNTKTTKAGAYSVSRVTSDIPFRWKYSLNFSYVDEVQNTCKEAMDLWGYRMAYNESHMKSNDFFPLDIYKM